MSLYYIHTYIKYRVSKNEYKKVSDDFNGNWNNKLVLTRKQIPNVYILLVSSNSQWHYLDIVKAPVNFHRSPITPYDQLSKPHIKIYRYLIGWTGQSIDMTNPMFRTASFKGNKQSTQSEGMLHLVARKYFLRTSPDFPAVLRKRALPTL